MATYYVRPDGNDSNTGLGSTTALAWQTITKAIGATGIAPGDTLYIAPGTYRGTFTAAFTNPANEGQRITIAGNPSASLFSGITAGPVVLTNYTSITASSGATVLTMAKDYITLQDVLFYANSGSNFGISADIQSTAFIANRIYCHTNENNSQSRGFSVAVSGNNQGPAISNSVFIGGFLLQGLPASAYNSNSVIRDCIFLKTSTSSGNTNGAFVCLSNPASRLGGITLYNCTIISNGSCVSSNWSSFPIATSVPSYVQNCYLRGTTGIDSSSTSIWQESYNIFECQVDRVLTNTGTGSVSKPFNLIDLHISNIQQWGILPFTAPITGSYGISAGLASGAPTADIFGVNWLAAPTIGSTESAQIVNRYYPTERNASTITIAPGSTSQSIELYLGATGLAFNTSGLSAYYVRNRTAPVAITLVTQTATGSWASGGFAQISSTFTPGVYRLDVPDAAFAAGADDVTIVVRGASGTNGAVMTVKLSSGGLTSAQTAAAVWDPAYTSYTAANSMGARVLKTTVDNRPAVVGTSQHIHANVHAIVDSTVAADELEGALLHNGTDYISADLLTPATSAALVRMGPYEVRADGLGASDPLDIQKGAQHGVDIQCVDAFGTGIDITSATVTAKVYNSGATLVDTYACTATYAADGRATFTIDTTVTDTPGTYTATITRTTGASDTQVFGPLRIYVRDI